MIKIAIASGKGGTGKTFIATNMFHSLLKKGYETTLVDCDAEAPNAAAFFNSQLMNSFDVYQMAPVIDPDKCIFCRKCQDYCNYNAIILIPHLNMIRVMEELCHGCGACRVACEYDAITEKTVTLGTVKTFRVYDNKILIEASINPGIMSPVPTIKKAIQEVRSFQGIALFDSPPGTSCPFIHTAAAADYVILVTEPTPFGLSDLEQSVKTLMEIKKPYGVIINRAGIGNDNVQKWIRQNNIELLMEIPYSREIAQRYSEGRLLNETLLETKFIGLINRIKQIILINKVKRQ